MNNHLYKKVKFPELCPQTNFFFFKPTTQPPHFRDWIGAELSSIIMLVSQLVC